MILILCTTMAALFIALRLIHQGLPLYAMAIAGMTLGSAWLLADHQVVAGAVLAATASGLIRSALKAL